MKNIKRFFIPISLFILFTLVLILSGINTDWSTWDWNSYCAGLLTIILLHVGISVGWDTYRMKRNEKRWKQTIKNIKELKSDN